MFYWNSFLFFISAHKFHELNQAYELLLDPLSCLALDAKMHIKQARTERFKKARMEKQKQELETWQQTEMRVDGWERRKRRSWEIEWSKKKNRWRLGCRGRSASSFRFVLFIRWLFWLTLILLQIHLTWQSSSNTLWKHTPCCPPKNNQTNHQSTELLWFLPNRLEMPLLLYVQVDGKNLAWMV